MTAVASPSRPVGGALPGDGPGEAPFFELPSELEAGRPPEARGLPRDGVRLMVSGRIPGARAPGAGDAAGLAHARFRDLPHFLEAGDLLVVNTSATIPAAVPARRRGGEGVEVRFSTEAPGAGAEEWSVVEVRAAGGAHPFAGAGAGETLALPAGARLELISRYLGSDRLWLARLGGAEPVRSFLAAHGHPVHYAYVSGEWPLDDYQTVFALEPGSAEMPSAARPFTADLVTGLVAGGVGIAPIVLHAGVSSPEAGEPPYPERYAVPSRTAAHVNAARGWGGRVIAVGTTVVRALETAATAGRSVAASFGWTDLTIGPERGLRAVDGLITGWHEPRASHLGVLEAAAGPELLERSYRAALEHRYLWHEFGDSHLILP